MVERKQSEWMRTVMQVRAIHKDKPFKEILKIAKEKYRKKKQKGGALQGAPIGIAPIMRVPRKPKFALE